MKNKKEELYIKALQYGRDNLGQAVKYSELQEFLRTDGYEDYDEFALRQFFLQVFINPNRTDGNDPSRVPTENQDFYLQDRGYFYLLEHEELKEARRASLVATYFAITALVVSIGTATASVYYSNKQLNTPTTIEASQFKKLIRKSDQS